MKNPLNRNLVFVLVLIASVFMLSSHVVASGINLPTLDYTGSFTYCDGTNKGESWCTASGPPGNSFPYQYMLSFSNLNIDGGNYADNQQFGWSSGISDNVTNAWFEIGTLYNSTSNNLTFGPTQGAGSTGPVSFALKYGTGANDYYFSGQIDGFIVDANATFGTRLNPLYDQENIINLTFNTSTAPSSQYIDEFKAAYDATIASGSSYRPNLFGLFTFTSPSGVASDFTNDASGSFQGKLAAAPEPVSSILFLSGAVTLGVRRFWKKKKIAIS